jgi:hypothetical protein
MVERDDGFSYGEVSLPHAFVQWKGTDVCMDFRCDCGADCHFDGDFAYFVRCPKCLTVWQMPWNLFPRKAPVDTKAEDLDNAKLMDADEC